MKRRFIPLFLLLFLSLFLISAVPPYQTKEIEIYIDGQALPGKTLRTEVSHAMRAERAGGFLSLYRNLCKSYSPKESLNYLAVGLGDYLSAECERRKTNPLNATLEWTKNKTVPFIYYAEHAGREVDLYTLGEAVARAMDIKGNARAYACTHEVPADMTLAKLKSVTKEIARFSTDFSSSGENRRHNLSLAAQAISGTVLLPGESFSFNGTVGERNEERGYRTANIVLNGEFVKGIGGGVCQVSTTLYNAVLLAGLPVEYAAAHSRPVSYVPCSQDCTVSSAIDFLFRNDSAYPLYIAAETKGNTLTLVLYGEKKPGYRSLESEIVQKLPYQRVYADGSAVTNPAAKEMRAGREGIKSRLFLIERKEGNITRTLIRENVYPPQNALCEKP